MTSYLSVDLDYWMLYKNDESSVKFFNKLFSLGKKIRIVRSHEQLLPHINKNKYDVLYNVDYHADIFGFKDQSEINTWLKNNKPDDGTWGVFVEWRNNSEFCWIMPDKNCIDIGKGACWPVENENPFNGSVTEWGKMSKKIGLQHIDLNSIQQIGVALSRDWTCYYSVQRVAKILGLPDLNDHIDYLFKPYYINSNKIKDRWYEINR